MQEIKAHGLTRFMQMSIQPYQIKVSIAEKIAENMNLLREIWKTTFFPSD